MQNAIAVNVSILDASVFLGQLPYNTLMLKEVEAMRGSTSDLTGSRRTRQSVVNMAEWPIKFTSGAKPGKALKRKSDAADKSKYEKNRKRDFKEEWQDGREWLEFDGEKMKCKLCIKYGVGDCRNTQNFVKGSTNFRYSGIIDHENSRYHRKAVERLYVKEDELGEKQSEAHKALVSMNQSIRKTLEMKFRNVHALVKQNRPLSDFTWINSPDEKKGLEHGKTYNNR